LALLLSISVILAFLQFNLPFLPSFIKIEFSHIPALVAAMRMGPLLGILVCFLKNVIMLLFSGTVGIGQVANFLLGCELTLIFYFFCNKNKFKSNIFFNSLLCSFFATIASQPVNYYLLYPIYYQFISEEKLLGFYKTFCPQIGSMLEAILLFNLPFTFLKNLLTALISFLICQHLVYCKNFTISS
jgi:riboflavin transporter FmnP